MTAVHTMQESIIHWEPQVLETSKTFVRIMNIERTNGTIPKIHLPQQVFSPVITWIVQSFWAIGWPWLTYRLCKHICKIPKHYMSLTTKCIFMFLLFQFPIRTSALITNNYCSKHACVMEKFRLKARTWWPRSKTGNPLKKTQKIWNKNGSQHPLPNWRCLVTKVEKFAVSLSHKKGHFLGILEISRNRSSQKTQLMWTQFPFINCPIFVLRIGQRCFRRLP